MTGAEALAKIQILTLFSRDWFASRLWRWATRDVLQRLHAHEWRLDRQYRERWIRWNRRDWRQWRIRRRRLDYEFRNRKVFDHHHGHIGFNST